MKISLNYSYSHVILRSVSDEESKISRFARNDRMYAIQSEYE